jgi:hypothetical protein
MSDEVEMGRVDQKTRAQQTALRSAVAAGSESVSGAEKSLARVTKNFREQATVLVAKGKSAATQLQKLDTEGRYSEMADVVRRFENDNAAALAALGGQVKKKKDGMTLSQVVLLVENVREIGRIASSL